MHDKYNDIDSLLNGIVGSNNLTLKDIFERKIAELNITPTAAYKLMCVQSRSIKGILSGSQKLVDLSVLTKLSHFLQLSLEEVIKLFLQGVNQNSRVSNITSQEILFIKENFDLAVLKKAGLIESLTDFEHIKSRITARLALRSIFEYRKPTIDVAFSAVSSKVDNNLTRAFWIKAALASLREIDNPHPYDREALIKLIPKIRWYTTKVERGLFEVAKLLYEIGITVVYQPSLETLKLRGATFNYNGKPAIVLTDYKGFYATLWFALIHEIFHVLFDWEQIKENKYHVTDDSNEQLSVQEREQEADNFARKYLFSKDKSAMVKSYINDPTYIAEYAAANDIHESFIYVFNAFDSKSSSDRMPWARARKYSPDINLCKKPIEIDWKDKGLIEKTVPSLALEFAR